ncbi:MAG: aminotransferase class V-fold PLP-dependent enzyme [Raoultibacter sp.]
MLNFTVGPVQMREEVRMMAADQIPYFRTPEFSQTMVENEALFLKFAFAPADSRAVFLTGSGTAGMEASVINTLTSEDKVLVVNGGSFGQRFVRLCEIHKIPCSVIELGFGTPLVESDLSAYEGQGYTAFLVNLDETSTGVLYDLALIHDFCRRNALFLIVDAISAFLADPIDMAAYEIDVMIAGSQKALAVAPGVSVLALSPAAQQRIAAIDSGCLYLDLESALHDGERGQTPFTPAVGILQQINRRLQQIDRLGVAAEIERVALQARDFRDRIAVLPFELFSKAPTNAVTALYSKDRLAKTIFSVLKDEYGMWVCPNGGALAETVFRVGHIGDLTSADNETLVAALLDMQDRGFLEGR